MKPSKEAEIAAAVLTVSALIFFVVSLFTGVWYMAAVFMLGAYFMFGVQLICRAVEEYSCSH